VTERPRGGSDNRFVGNLAAFLPARARVPGSILLAEHFDDRLEIRDLPNEIRVTGRALAERLHDRLKILDLSDEIGVAHRALAECVDGLASRGPRCRARCSSGQARAALFRRR